jgi:hypothetical protein
LEDGRGSILFVGDRKGRPGDKKVGTVSWRLSIKLCRRWWLVVCVSVVICLCIRCSVGCVCLEEEGKVSVMVVPFSIFS